MKTVIKRTMSVIAIVVMIAIMAVPAVSAASISAGTIPTTDTTLTIPKGITIKNTVQGNYYGPNVVYSYTIEPVAPVDGSVVKDANNNNFPVETGVADGASLLNSGNVTFTSQVINNVTVEGIETSQNLSVSVDLTKFTKPGVYRYLITDVTTTETLFNSGIVRPADYDTTRYLDVYIKNGTSALEVAGYTLTAENLVDTSSAKNAGFIADAEAANGTDSYRTYNISIQKQVTGDMGDKTHEFPFTINIDNNSKSYYYGTDSNAVTNVSSAASQSVNLKHGDVFYIRGLAPKALIGIIESNNTSDTYKVTVDGRDGSSSSWSNLVAVTDAAPGNTVELTQGAITDYAEENSASSVAHEGVLTNYREIRFTNDLASVSPTGIVLRFAPFALLFGFAIVFLMVSRRTKAAKKETSSI